MRDKHLATIFLIILFFFTPFLVRPSLLTIRDNDLGRTYVPLFTFFKDSILKDHQFPLWRPSQMMGESLVASPLWSPVYPPNLMFILLPVSLGSVIYLLFHLELAALSTYFLGRSFKFTQIASLAAALFYAFSTKMLLHISAGHITMIAAASFIPLAFLSIRNLFVKNSFTWIAVGSISLAAMYITYPTIFYYTVIFLVIYSLYKFPPKLIRDFNFAKLLKYLSPFILLAIIAFGLTAVALLPQLEFAPYSTRGSMGFADVAQPLWNLKRFMTSLIFPYPIFSSLDHEAFLYLGIVPSILSIIGFFYTPKNKRLILLVLFILALAFAAGASTPVFKIAYNYLPILKYSRITTRLWFNVALVVALLAAFAISKIKNRTIIYLLLLIFLIENLFIGYKKTLSVPNLSFTNESLYQYLANDHDIFRVYCTTYCFNPQLLAKYKIQTLAGETPIQDKNVVTFLEEAGNYKHDKFAVIFPPYQIWQVQSPPQPDPAILARANVKYVASTYDLKEKNLQLVGKYQNILLYKNLLPIPTKIYSPSYQPKSFMYGLLISLFTIASLILYIRTRRFK